MVVHPYLGFFVVLEGPDGCGKGKQAELLYQRLLTLGVEVVHTREPGGMNFATGKRIVVAEELRQTMIAERETEDKPSPVAELLIMAASRRQHVDKLIRPRLEVAATVMSERYFQSTLAYQQYGRGIDQDEVWRSISMAVGDVYPDVVIIIDVPAEVGAARKKAQALASGGALDRFEGEGLEFLQRVRQGYLEIAPTQPNYHLVDGTASIPFVAEEIWQIVQKAYNDSLHKVEALKI